jgi:hypothetical protein
VKIKRKGKQERVRKVDGKKKGGVQEAGHD